MKIACHVFYFITKATFQMDLVDTKRFGVSQLCIMLYKCTSLIPVFWDVYSACKVTSFSKSVALEGEGK